MITSGSGPGEFAPFVTGGSAAPAARPERNPPAAERSDRSAPQEDAAQTPEPAADRPLWNDGTPHPLPGSTTMMPNGTAAPTGEREAGGDTGCTDAPRRRPAGTASTDGAQRQPY